LRVLVVSDVHYERRVFRGVDESRAWEWLLGIVDLHGPDLLLGAGDWGSAVNPRDFYRLLVRTRVLTIYGNHENMRVLESLYNVGTSEYTPILMEDGRVYQVGPLRVAGISGLVAKRRREKKGVPRKTPEEFLAAARRLEGAGVDVLLLHEAPYLPGLYPGMRRSLGPETALEVVRMVAPRLVVNGHMHMGFRHAWLPWGTLLVHVDSSQAARIYLILEPVGGALRVEAWRDREHLETLTVPLG